MANELYLDPGSPGPFTGLPLTSQLFQGTGSTWGSLKDWGYAPVAGGTNFGRQILNVNREMWQYGLKTTQPTAAGVIHQITEVSATAGTGAPFYRGSYVWTPAIKAVYKYTGSGTVGGNQFLASGLFMFQGSARIQRALFRGVQWDGNAGWYPICAYVWRPSTQAVVGWLWDVSAFATADAYSWAVDYVGGIGFNANRFTRPWYSMSKAYTPGSSPPSYFTTAAKMNNSVSFVAGDYLVFECWWVMAYYGNGVFPANLTLGADIWIGGAGSTYSPGDLNATETTDPTYGTKFRSSATVPAGEVPTQGGSYAGVPNLTSVTPTAGTILRLGFDGPVGVSSPTFGAKLDRRVATAATAFDATTIDITEVIDACPPTEVLSGAASDPDCGTVADPIPCPVNTWPPGVP